ncbi:MAG TPA: MarR family transcriptional regulator [Solirubrobacterales bacterium]|nr:MarR family transcriptional regulator [Solirubrobacterales bacterium]
MNAQQLEARRRDLHASLDISRYATDTAGEAWALMARMLFVEGKPRFPTIAAELDLSPPQAIVMRLLGEPRAMSDLATAMACDNSNVTGIVDRLEERGLVERRPAEYDRRVKLIAPTKAGDGVRDELNRRLAVPPEALANLSEKDKRTLRDILRKAFAE